MAHHDDLKQAGLKRTMPRLKILEILSDTASKHLSAEDVYRLLLEQDQSIGLATVYRALTEFERAGIVTRHNFENERAVFELADEEHHDHMVCLACGLVVEFFDQKIENQQEAVAKEHGFTLQDHAMVLYGQCTDCQRSSNAK